MSRVETEDLRRALGAGIEERAELAAREAAERAARDGLVEVAFATYDSPLGEGQDRRH